MGVFNFFEQQRHTKEGAQNNENATFTDFGMKKQSCENQKHPKVTGRSSRYAKIHSSENEKDEL